MGWLWLGPAISASFWSGRSLRLDHMIKDMLKDIAFFIVTPGLLLSGFILVAEYLR